MDGLVTVRGRRLRDAVRGVAALRVRREPLALALARDRSRPRRRRSRRAPASIAPPATCRATCSEAPRLIRWTAFSCFLFGQMFVPGLVVGLFGIVVAGVGIVSIPGLITAAKIYRAGFALLRREPRWSAVRARDAAAWALWLNGIIFVGSFVLMRCRCARLAFGHRGAHRVRRRLRPRCRSCRRCSCCAPCACGKTRSSPTRRPRRRRVCA